MGNVATILYVRAANAGALAKLAPEQAAAVLDQFRSTMKAVVAEHGGTEVRVRPDSVLAAFTDEPRTRPDSSYRALKAAQIAVHDVTQLADALPSVQGSESLRLVATAGVHRGKIDVGLTPTRTGELNVSGEAIEFARVLQSTAVDLRWSIAASCATLSEAGERVECGRIGAMVLPDDTFLDIAEVTGLAPRKDSSNGAKTYQVLRDALVSNRRSLERHRPGDLGNTTTTHRKPNVAVHFSVAGYRILRKIGEGGMASIFLVEEQGQPAPQVLKVMRINGTGSADALQRFMQEFALMAPIRHPYIAKIHRQGFSAGHAYIVMEYFPRGDLRGLLRSGIQAEVALAYSWQLASALSAIHRAGVVHRDLKPDNLMIREDGTLALGDFGIAKHVSMSLTETAHGEIVGTPYYVSPEQVLGMPVDLRCDLYSLGVILYEMLTGEKPYRASTPEDLLELHVAAPLPVLPPPYTVVQPFINRLMAKSPEQRYPSADAFISDLSRFKKPR
ncbi:MAG TPA: protein kinase [Burkholderiales bacterium]|nr:protein kinase [Burkholderiales bacterium]